VWNHRNCSLERARENERDIWDNNINMGIMMIGWNWLTNVSNEGIWDQRRRYFRF
jgi:hypothetical protein